MRRLITKSTWLGLLSTTLVLMACGGGGGGGGGGFTPPSIPDTLVNFGSAEATEIAQIADLGTEMGATLSTPVLFGVQASDVPDKTVMVREVMDKALRQTLSAITSGSSSAQYTTGVAVGPMTETCASGGWGDIGDIIFTGDLADPDSINTGLFTMGDTVTMDISNCRVSSDSSVIITGSVTFTFNTDIAEFWFGDLADHSGCINPGDCVAGMTTDFNNFGGGNNMFSIVIHGDVTTSTAFDVTGNETGTLAMNSLWFVLKASGQIVGLHLRNLDFTATMDTSGNYTLDGYYELGATPMGGYISVEVNGVGGNELDAYASTGNIMIAGAGTDSIKITYVTYNEITLGIDFDGIDGDDLTLTGDWFDFENGTMQVV